MMHTTAAHLAYGEATTGDPQDSISSLLRMAVGTETLAVPIESVREILEVSRLTPLPRTPTFVRGVMNLRGAVVPVIDLAARLSLAPSVLGRRTCIVVVECQHVTKTDAEEDDIDNHAGSSIIGLLVDAVFEVFDTPHSRIEPPPALGTRIAAELLSGMTRARNSVIGIIALEQILSPQALTAMIAKHND
jgi:purine-binding chemotaxis protein CheW